METGLKLWVFPCVIMLSFLTYWIVLTPYLWHLFFKMAVTNQWSYYWHKIFWITVFIIWLALAIIFVIFWKVRHKRRLERKTEIIKEIVQQKQDFLSGLEMTTLYYTKPVDCRDSDCLSENKSELSNEEMKNCKSFDEMNKDFLMKCQSVKVKMRLGAYLRTKSDDEFDSDKLPSEKSNVIKIGGQWYHVSPDNKRKSYVEPIVEIENEQCPNQKRRNTFHDPTRDFSVSNRKNFKVPPNLIIEKEESPTQKRRNTFHEQDGGFLPKYIPHIYPSERIFSRDCVFKKSVKNKNDCSFSEKSVTDENSLAELDESRTEKVVLDKVSIKRPSNHELDFVKKNGNGVSEATVKLSSSAFSKIEQSQLANQSVSAPDSANKPFGSASSKNQQSQSKNQPASVPELVNEISGSASNKNEKTQSENSPDSYENNSIEKKQDVSVNIPNNDITRSTPPLQSLRDSSSEGPYEGLPQIEKFDKYLKIVTVTPLSPRDSFFSDLTTANDQYSDSALHSIEVFPNLESPTREYFVADVVPMQSIAKSEAFIVIDNTAETNKLSSKRFILTEDNSDK